MYKPQLPFELWREIIHIASGIDIPLHASLLDPTTRTKRWVEDSMRLCDIEDSRWDLHGKRTKKRMVCGSLSMLVAIILIYRFIEVDVGLQEMVANYNRILIPYRCHTRTKQTSVA